MVLGLQGKKANRVIYRAVFKIKLNLHVVRFLDTVYDMKDMFEIVVYVLLMGTDWHQDLASFNSSPETKVNKRHFAECSLYSWGYYH